MSDIVNDYFRRFYPADLSPERFEYDGMLGGMLRYSDKAVSNIFPEMVCVDGFKMSVQGHAGAYSSPRDDFAESYGAVEILCPPEPLLGDRFECLSDGELLYPYVPVEKVIAAIEKHGGLRPPSTVKGESE